jgi:hypothetical protein
MLSITYNGNYFIISYGKHIHVTDERTEKTLHLGEP